MLSPESSEPGRQALLTSITIPDLSDRIIRSDNQYYEAGGFGDVFRCRYKDEVGVKEVAVKSFRFHFTVDEHERDGGKVARMVRRELGIWKRLSHRNVVPFLGIVYGFGRQGSASLVSIWMPHGTLRMFLEAHDDRLAVAHRLQLLLDIANGLQYLHSFPLVHGDLTSNNVLLDHNYNACLTDFGCASMVGEIPQGFTYLNMSTVGPGTLRWAAPEHFSLNEEDTKHTIKSDIYSFGNMAFLVLSGKSPWSEVRGDAAVVLRLSQGLKPGRPLARPIDDRHWTLIERCWSSIPERPLAEDVVSSLQQHLDAHSTPPPLRDLFDVPTPSSSVLNCPGNGDDGPDGDATLIDLPFKRPRSRTPSGTSPFASPSVPEDMTQCPDSSTSSPEQVHGPPSNEREDLENKNIAKADKDGSQKRPKLAFAGYSYSNPSGPDSKKRPEIATAGYFSSNPQARSTIPKHGLDVEDTVSQKKPIGGEHVTRPSTDGPLSPPRWVRGTLLGTGTYGRVYLAHDLSTGEIIAVKQVKKDGKDSQRNFVPELKIEQKILSGLDHPHIITYLGSEETTTFLNVLMEYVPGGSIASCLRDNGTFDEDVVKSFTAQIFDGLAYLHANHIIHRNIETNSILVDLSGICKISGFGNAQRADDNCASWAPMRGIVLWTAPEVIGGYGGKWYSYKVDIWSGGCVLLRMWVGGRPSDEDMFVSMVKAVRRGMSPPLPLGMIPSDLAVDFRNRCFAIDPEARASAAELIQHPYLTLAPDWRFTGFT